jgi:hypothetical protein
MASGLFFWDGVVRWLLAALDADFAQQIHEAA